MVYHKYSDNTTFNALNGENINIMLEMVVISLTNPKSSHMKPSKFISKEIESQNMKKKSSKLLYQAK